MNRTLMKDIVGNYIEEGCLVAYSVTSDESLRLGVVTGISELSPILNCTNSLYMRKSFIQITPLEKSKIHNKWYMFYGRCVVLDASKINTKQMERYYYLLSLLDDWVKNGHNIHPRDIPAQNNPQIESEL